MSICLDHESFEYQSLKNRTDIPGFHFDAICSYYLENYGRFPKIDEIPNTNSLNVLSNKYKNHTIQKDETTETEYYEYIISKTKLHKDLSITTANKDNVKSKLIDLYPDLNIEVLQQNNDYIIRANKIPSKWYVRPHTYSKIRSDVNTSEFNVTAINHYVQAAMTKLGRNVYTITDIDLASKKWRGIIDKSKTAKAFIYNGDIYINTDHATIEDQLHEFLHLVLGAISKNEGESIYYTLLDYMQSDEQWLKQQLDDFTTINGKLDRSKIDILEELFVREASKYLTGQQSKISEFNKNIQRKIIEDLIGGFNKLLDADYSIDANLSEVEYNNPLLLFQNTLSHVAQNAGSNIFKENIVEAAEQHRIRANLIAKYLKFSNITEVC